MVRSDSNDLAHLLCLLSTFILQTIKGIDQRKLLRANERSEFEAVHLWHLDVCEHQSNLVLAAGCPQAVLDQLQGLLTGVTSMCIDAQGLQLPMQTHQVNRLVINNQNF